MERKRTINYNFSLVVVKHPDGRYLLVQETQKHNFLWWLPGGRVEHGDSFETTALKETQEEGGLSIQLVGLLKIERSIRYDYVRERFIFLAKPVVEPPPEVPKDTPDAESNAALWVNPNFDKYKYTERGPEPRKWFHYVEDGKEVFPLSLVTSEEAVVTDQETLKRKVLSVEGRLPHMTENYVRVVVRNEDGLWLVVKDGEGWRLPGVDVSLWERSKAYKGVSAEYIVCANDILESLGVPAVSGLLNIEIITNVEFAKHTVTFFAKATQTNESCSPSVAWGDLERIVGEYHLNEKELKWVEYVANGGKVYSLGIWGTEMDY